MLLISKYGSHITIPTLLPSKVLNKQPFSINKSLTTLIFISVLRRFFFYFRVFIQTFLALFCLPRAFIRETWSDGIEMESLNGVNGRELRCENENESSCVCKKKRSTVFYSRRCRHSSSEIHINIFMTISLRDITSSTKDNKKSVYMTWTSYQTSSIGQQRSIKRLKMTDACLSSGHCRKCNFD